MAPVDSLSSVVADVPVSRAIASAELVAGRRVAAALFDAAQPLDAMVVGVMTNAMCERLMGVVPITPVSKDTAQPSRRLRLC